jgi:hypothetical protein
VFEARCDVCSSLFVSTVIMAQKAQKALICFLCLFVANLHLVEEVDQVRLFLVDDLNLFGEVFVCIEEGRKTLFLR